MSWSKGQSGNPLGASITTGKPFSEALRIARLRPHGRGKDAKVRLAVIAENLACAAVKGEPWAIRECFDRIDGKAAQSIEAKVDLISSMSDDQLERELIAALLALGIIPEEEETGALVRPN
jgi:hypothetical protein